MERQGVSISNRTVGSHSGGFLHSGLTPLGLADDEALVSAAQAGKASKGASNTNSDLKIMIEYAGALERARGPVPVKCFEHCSM